jgi:MoaA/NifB/PqqE/SkfB family radical SAM enzyme
VEGGVNPARYALAVAKNHAGLVPRPGICTYLVTYRCNARCGMCDSWRMKPGGEMTATDVRRVFGGIGPLDAVRITGGEPFLREDLLAIAHAILEASSPSVMHITTNGSLPERVEEFHARFREQRRLAFLVSLDGMPEEHDKSRGADATFELALRTVRMLVASGARVAVNHTIISPRSLSDHRALRGIFAPMGVDVSAVIAYESSSMYGLKLRGKKAEHLIQPGGYPLHHDLDRTEVIAFLEEELAALDAMLPSPLRLAKRYYLRGLLARLRGDADPKPRPRCVALRSHVRLLPDGRVPVCQFNTETVGSLAAESFDAVWHGAEAGAARGWVDACGGCWAECEAMPSAIYTADLVRALV